MPKILATIGLATESIPQIKKILKFTNLVRLNGAHNQIEWHEKFQKNKNKSKYKILLDLPEPNQDRKIKTIYI